MGAYIPFDTEKEKPENLGYFFTRFTLREHLETSGSISFREIIVKYLPSNESRSYFTSDVVEAVKRELVERSELHLETSREDFFAAIDQAVSIAGLTCEEVGQAIREYLEAPGSEERRAKFQSLTHKLYPVYVVLRTQGYNPKELCS